MRHMETTTVTKDVEGLCINTIRTLSIDAIQKANSGHPGAPMALAPVMYAIWESFLRHNPENPDLFARDRFVLSCGHASMLLYSTLHMYGYDVPLEEIKKFRQYGSICAGHPEKGVCPGVETTTGPLGQGCGNSVGMALAQKSLAAHFNRPGHDVVDWQVVTLCSDGDIMEGVSAEAATLAGHLGLDNLTWVYDDNSITIEGSTDLAMSEDVARRFEAYGWDVSLVPDANDVDTVSAALRAAREREGRPSLVIVKSHIAYGSPNKQDTCDSHGAPLGEDEVRLTKQAYGWDPDAKFLVPAEAKESMSAPALERGRRLESDWNARVESYRSAHPELAAELDCFLRGDLPEGWDAALPAFDDWSKPIAGRSASGAALNAVASSVPWLMGGSADLGSSNKTQIKEAASFQKDTPFGRNLHFGVREHAMGSIANGMALVGMRPYTGTFLIFSDYMRPVHRLAAMMELPVIWVYSHDSIGVGEDGPTHQPIEQLSTLRAIPNLDVVRPGDANEAVEAWRYMMKLTDRPAALAVSRQNHATIDRNRYAAADGLHRGAYVLGDCEGTPALILMATGSELEITVRAYERLTAEGIAVRVVSMPCIDQFERQSAAYRDEVLPPEVKARVSVEAASTYGWHRWVGDHGRSIGRDDFGASAPGAVLFEEFGFTVDAVVAAARSLL